MNNNNSTPLLPPVKVDSRPLVAYSLENGLSNLISSLEYTCLKQISESYTDSALAAAALRMSVSSLKRKFKLHGISWKNSRPTRRGTSVCEK